MNSNYTSYTPAVLATIDVKARKAMQKACNVAQNWIVRKSFAGMRHGKTYRVPDTKYATYTASAPGEYPASPTGELRKHIETNVDSTLLAVTGIVGTSVPHGITLEKKDPHKGGRPWLQRSLNEATGAIKAELNERWF